jgi:hypothetical protein
MDREKLRIDFGEPEHGWLPVNIYSGDFRLDLDASDVPINPIGSLISAILQVTQGNEVTSSWHLEPAYYHMKFSKKGDIYALAILFAENEIDKGELIFETTGTFDSVILPLCRGIKEFLAKTYDELHWPRTDVNEIEKLSVLCGGR